MAGRWRRTRWVRWFAVGLIGLGYFAGRPATLMTVFWANWKFGALRPGVSREKAEAWVVAQGIPPSSGFPSDKNISYDMLTRGDETPVRETWTDGYGHKTVAEWAGLKEDEASSMIRITYLDAGWQVLGWIEVAVYLFFDKNDRLMKYYAHKFMM